MFCRFGIKLCRFLRWLMKILTIWLDWLDTVHDRIYCLHCPDYVVPPLSPQKGVV